MPTLLPRLRLLACETHRKRTARRARAGHLVLCAVAVLLMSGLPIVGLAQAGAQPPAAGEPAAADEAHAADQAHAADEEHAGGVMEVVARLVNFSILAGTLVYFLRSPFAAYLVERSTQIRSDLVAAAEMKRTAAAQIEEIDRKMAALPGELEALRLQGGQEIAAEQARIRSAAAAERDRLLEQARREIDQQVKVAERELVSHAADLAVGLAGERIRKTITEEDQKRLADRYVQQLKH